MPGAALQNGAPKEAGRLADGDQRRDAEGAGGLAENRDLAGIPAKGADVVLHPAQRSQLVEQPEVGGAIPKPEEALRPQPVIDGHADDAVAGKAAAVVDRDRARAPQKRSAGDPHDYRKVMRAGVGRPDVEIQAVLATDSRVAQHLPERFGIRRLGRNGPVLVRRSHFGPRLRRLRWPKAVGAERRGREGNPLERRDAIADATLDRPGVRLHDDAGQVRANRWHRVSAR